MSDTPRCDFETTSRLGEGSFNPKWLPADFARQLERELNAAIAALSGRTVSCSNCNALAAENAELRKANEIISGRESELIAKYCRAKDENAAMKKLIRQIYYDTETYADGAPDASLHDKLCNEISSKLQPYLK